MKYFLLAILIALLTSCGDSEKVTYEVGYRGKARVNPYLAAERLLSKYYDDDYDVSSLPGWSSYDEETSFVVMPSSALSVEATARRLMRWVDDGGHLVCVIEAGEGIYSDWGWSRWVFRDDLDEFAGLSYILEETKVELYDPKSAPPESKKKPSAATGVAPATGSGSSTPSSSTTPASSGSGGSSASTPSKKTPDDQSDYYKRYPRPSDNKGVLIRSTISEEELEVEFDGDLRLVYQQDLSTEDYGVSDEDERYYFLSLKRGEYGRVSFINHARPLRNAYLQNADNASFLIELSNLSYEGSNIFVYAGGTSFMRLLLKYGWRILLALLIFIILWLMKNLVRFGPIKELPDETNRSYTHHLAATGAFLWRRRRVDALLEQLRREVMDRYEYTQGAKNEYAKDELFEGFAKKLGIPVERVIEAFSRKDVKDGGALTRIVADLKRMKSIL